MTTKHCFIVFYLYSRFYEIEYGGETFEEIEVGEFPYECENDIPKKSDLIKAIKSQQYWGEKELKGITGITELTKSSYEYYKS